MYILPRIKIFSYIILLILTISGCQKSKSLSQNQLLSPLPQDPSIQVYFNHSQSSQYQESYRQKTRLGDDLETKILDVIDKAESRIDIAVQELRLPKIAQALVEKQQAGIQVRLILENNYSRAWSSLKPREIQELTEREKRKYQEFTQFVDINQDGKITPEEINQRDALAIIKNNKIPWIDDTADGSAGSGLMHHKFVVVDNRFVIISSANFTWSDTSGDLNNLESLGNANNLLKIDSPEVAALFTEEFNIMWGDGPGRRTNSKFGLKKPIRKPKQITLVDNTITINFSPISLTQPWRNSSNALIGKTLAKASKTIDIALFVFSDQKIANILENQNDKIVEIRALIDSQFAYRHYSEALDMMGLAISNNCQYEINNNPWQNPITTVGVPILPKGDLLHHKFAVIDNQTVITGSHNWSEAANHSNDETVIIIESPKIAAHFQREFNRLYTKIKPGLPPKIKSRMDSQINKCPQIPPLKKPLSIQSFK